MVRRSRLKESRMLMIHHKLEVIEVSIEVHEDGTVLDEKNENEG